MSATMTTVVKGAEEGGSFFTRLAWYYQMGALLVVGRSYCSGAPTRCSTAISAPRP